MTNETQASFSNADPADYDQLAQPYPDKKCAEDALRLFMEKVEKLRRDFRVPDVVIAGSVVVEGEEQRTFAATGMGSTDQVVHLALNTLRQMWLVESGYYEMHDVLKRFKEAQGAFRANQASTANP